MCIKGQNEPGCNVKERNKTGLTSDGTICTLPAKSLPVILLLLFGCAEVNGM